MRLVGLWVGTASRPRLLHWGVSGRLPPPRLPLQSTQGNGRAHPRPASCLAGCDFLPLLASSPLLSELVDWNFF